MAYGREEVKKVLPTIVSSGLTLKSLVKIMMSLWDSGYYYLIEYIIKTDPPIKTELLLEIMINLSEYALDGMVNHVFSAGYTMPLSQKNNSGEGFLSSLIKTKAYSLEHKNFIIQSVVEKVFLKIDDVKECVKEACIHNKYDLVPLILVNIDETKKLEKVQELLSQTLLDKSFEGDFEPTS